MQLVKKQEGLTLIEMMIAMLIGLIVMGTVITVFITTLKANNDDVKMIRLNQEIRAIMTIMTRDLRRADYWGGTGASPFNVITKNDPAVWVDGASLDTVVFSYDVDTDGIDDGNAESFGFRWQGAGNAIEMNSNNAWNALSDNGVVTINNLSFDLSLANTDDGSAINTVTISIGAELTTDATVSRTVTQAVRLRNIVLP